MTITSHIINNILKVYSENFVGERVHPGDEPQRQSSEDIVTLSEEGKKLIMERLKNKVVEDIRSKG